MVSTAYACRGGCTPYLLNGNADAPTDLAQAIPIDIFDEPFSVGPFDGTIALSVELELFGVNYLSTMVDLQSEMGGPVDATVVNEGEVVDFALVEPGVDETTSAWGTVHGEVDIAATLTFIPSIEIQGLTLDEELAVDFPLNEGVAIAFEPAQMDFAGPPEPPEPETTGSPEPETTEGPDSDSDGSTDGDPTVDPTTGTTGDASAGPETTGDPMGDSGTDSDGVEDEGCGCSADEGDRGAAGFALLGLALLGLRRRRR